MTRIRIGDLYAGQGIHTPLTPDDAAPALVLKRSYSRPGFARDVTLINMNLRYTFTGLSKQRENHVPQGVLSIAAYLEQDGWNVEFVDYQLFSHRANLNAQLFVQSLGKPAGLVGFSCMTGMLPFVILCAEEIKKRYPDCQIVLGGAGVSPVAAEIIAAFPFIDSAVVGDGELHMRDFVRGNITLLPARRPVTDLDRLPLPAYHLIDFKDYDYKSNIVTSRGCPYACTFCSELQNFGGVVRNRSVENVLRELELIHARSGQTMFLFQDDILPLDRTRFEALLHGFSGLSFSIRWGCMARVDLMDEELLARMAQSGCRHISYGVESGSNKVLKRIKKGFTIEKAYDTALMSTRYIPNVHAFFMWGFPFEEPEDFEETLHWVSEFRKAGIAYVLMEYLPFPGTALCREYAGEMQFRKNDYHTLLMMGHQLFDFDAAAEDHPAINELIARHPRIFSGFYHFENIAKLHMQRRIKEIAAAGQRRRD